MDLNLERISAKFAKISRSRCVTVSKTTLFFLKILNFKKKLEGPRSSNIYFFAWKKSIKNSTKSDEKSTKSTEKKSIKNGKNLSKNSMKSAEKSMKFGDSNLKS
jgi:hypothetical protein